MLMYCSIAGYPTTFYHAHPISQSLEISFTDVAAPWLSFVLFIFRSFLIIGVTVSEEDIAKAGKAIKEVEEKLLPQCTRRFKANFLIGKADYFIRRATRPGGDIGEQERDLRTGNNH